MDPSSCVLYLPLIICNSGVAFPRQRLHYLAEGSLREGLDLKVSLVDLRDTALLLDPLQSSQELQVPPGGNLRCTTTARLPVSRTTTLRPLTVKVNPLAAGKPRESWHSWKCYVTKNILPQTPMILVPQQDTMLPRHQTWLGSVWPGLLTPQIQIWSHLMILTSTDGGEHTRGGELIRST